MDEKEIDKKYIDFIENLIGQIQPLLPKDVNKLQEDYLVSNIRKSAMLMASGIQDDEEFSRIDFEQQCFYIQIMAEWSFHKEIDLFRSGIPAKYWKVVMQKIWYAMWEVMYACVKNEAPETVVLSLVERFVNRTYRDAVEELKENEIIDEKTEEKAKEQSNIKIMAQEVQEVRAINQKVKNIVRYLVLGIIISILVSFLILKFKIYGVIVILTLLVYYNVFSSKRNE
ncbi:unknown [Clostridium sp. CAG:813]|nr:unknown [Clostridium sp. CAG:813]